MLHLNSRKRIDFPSIHAITQQGGGSSPVHTAHLFQKGTQMSALSTAAEQVHEFGSFLYTAQTLDFKALKDVYRLDSTTNAHIIRTRNGDLQEVRFVKNN